MRRILGILCCFLLPFFCSLVATGQVAFPKGFRLVKGQSLSGKDDEYTDGKYTFQVFRTGWLDADTDLRKTDGFQQTKDTLFWRTGKDDGVYFYEVYNGELVRLSAPINDKGFSYYSKWLLSAMRKNHHSGKLLFPPGGGRE